MTIGKFIGGVGALIWRAEDNRYLLLKRSPQKDFAQGIWEPVTGRVDQGEGFEDALHREVSEELGGAHIRPLFILGTTHFYRGKPIPENELLGVVYLCQLLSGESFTLSAEHTEYRWLTAGEAFALLTDASPPTTWTRRVIERAEAVRKALSTADMSSLAPGSFELG